jgi:hypothetical protein
MNYQSETIWSALQKLNKEYFLPTLQREFVWDSSRICKLFDSLMRGYPISSFLLWKVPPEAHGDLEIYKFLKDVSELGRHNERKRIDLVSNLTFVLDGQQRLTSMLVGLGGSYEARRKYGRVGHKACVQQLYLDLLRDGHKVEDNAEPSYGFAFREPGPSPDRKAYWFEVGRILECPADSELGKFVQATLNKVKAYRNVSPEHLDLIAANLRRLHAVVFDEAVILHYTETNTDQKRMLEIFVRANSGGKPLSKPDLLLSNLTVHWKERSADENAREEVKRFVDELNSSLNAGILAPKRALSQDFVLKSCLVLLNRPVAYDLLSFNRDTCEAILEEWKEIKAAIAETVSVCSWFGLNGMNLTSANTLIPVAYFIYWSRGTARLRADTESDARNAILVRRWLILSLLNGVFSGNADSMLTQVRDVLKRHTGPGNDFPAREIDAAVARAGRVSTSDPRTIERILALKYKDPRCFLALTLLFDERGWGTIAHDVDHIFPQVAFKSFLKTHKDQMDCLGNVTLLLQVENQAKKGRAFGEWIQTREPGFIRRHLIPADRSLWQMEKFPYFLEERNRLIQGRLRVVLGV